jgi:hypothetical protein
VSRFVRLNRLFNVADRCRLGPVALVFAVHHDSEYFMWLPPRFSDDFKICMGVSRMFLYTLQRDIKIISLSINLDPQNLVCTDPSGNCTETNMRWESGLCSFK